MQRVRRNCKTNESNNNIAVTIIYAAAIIQNCIAVCTERNSIFHLYRAPYDNPVSVFNPTLLLLPLQKRLRAIYAKNYYERNALRARRRKICGNISRTLDKLYFPNVASYVCLRGIPSENRQPFGSTQTSNEVTFRR